MVFAKLFQTTGPLKRNIFTMAPEPPNPQCNRYILHVHSLSSLRIGFDNILYHHLFYINTLKENNDIFFQQLPCSQYHKYITTLDKQDTAVHIGLSCIFYFYFQWRHVGIESSLMHHAKDQLMYYQQQGIECLLTLKLHFKGFSSVARLVTLTS